jgi:hypothetical protein
VPSRGRFDPSAMVTRSLTSLRVAPDAGQALPIAALRAVQATSDTELRTVAEHTGARLLDPFPNVCGSASSCSPFFGAGEPKFSDGASTSHLRAGASALPRFLVEVKRQLWCQSSASFTRSGSGDFVFPARHARSRTRTSLPELSGCRDCGAICIFVHQSPRCHAGAALDGACGKPPKDRGGAILRW